jgi:hypothetical protein
MQKCDELLNVCGWNIAHTSAMTWHLEYPFVNLKYSTKRLLWEGNPSFISIIYLWHGIAPGLPGFIKKKLIKAFK